MSCEWKRSRRLTIATNAPVSRSALRTPVLRADSPARVLTVIQREIDWVFDATDQADFNGCFIGRQALRGALCGN